VAFAAVLAAACGDDGIAGVDATATTSGDPPGTSGPESSDGDASSSDPGETTDDPGETTSGGSSDGETTSVTDATSSEDATSAASSSSSDDGDEDDESTDGSTTRDDDESSSSGDPDDDCGNGEIDPGEACDGLALGGASCESLGFLGGVLACDPTCDLDATACTLNGGGDCCLANGEPGCEDDTCTTDVCYSDEGCCADGWDDECVALAADICSTCGGTPLPYPCVEEDIGSALGSPVASGSTVGSDDDLAESCGGGGGVDHVLVWRAPFDGTFSADTIGSDFDTAIDVRIGCDVGIACDDDGGGGGASYVAGPLSEGQEIVISVTGSAGASGNWVLNVEAM
jgi:hypothetical protein